MFTLYPSNAHYPILPAMLHGPLACREECTPLAHLPAQMWRRCDPCCCITTPEEIDRLVNALGDALDSVD